jgi:N-acetylmuramoyl-L-alanine amidase
VSITPFVAGQPQTYHFQVPPFAGAAPAQPASEPYPGIDSNYPYVTSPRTLHGQDGVVRAIVIHATEGSTAAGAVTRITDREASWHWLIPGPDDPQHGNAILACVPERLAGWHVENECRNPDVNDGAQYTNMWSIGIEIVNTQTAGATFTNWQIETAAALTRAIWSAYSAVVDIVSHAKLDPVRRSDPGPLFPWDRFRTLVTTVGDAV